MANAITKFKKYIDKLDEVYKLASKTSKLDGDSALVQAGASTNEIVIPKISMSGLGNYSRNDGYVKGDVTLTNETVTFNYDRGRKFNVDTMDNEETAGVAFGRLASEFIRTKVVPEMDAFRFATYAGISGISTATGTLSTGADALTALITAESKMDDDEVPEEDRHLFITSTLRNLILNVDTTKSKEVMSDFASITTVPQSRFCTAIDLYDGSTTGEELGGYVKHEATYKASADTSVESGKTYYTKSGDVYTAVASPTGNPSTSSYLERVTEAGKDINFMIIHKPALMQYPKHTVNKVITPEANQENDGYMFFYRGYGLADAYENKVAGIYCHHKA